MWKTLGAVAVDWQNDVKAATSDKAPKLKHALQFMRDLWEDSKTFRISDVVMMVEKQILSRLLLEGHLVLPTSSNKNPMDLMRLVMAFVSLNCVFSFSECVSAVAVLSVSKASAVEDAFCVCGCKAHVHREVVGIQQGIHP